MKNNFKVIDKRIIGFENEFRWNIEKFYSKKINLIVGTMNSFDDIFNGCLINKYNTQFKFRGKALEELNNTTAVQFINDIILEQFFDKDMLESIDKYVEYILQRYNNIWLKSLNSEWQLSNERLENLIKISTAMKLFIPRISNMTDEITKPQYIKFKSIDKTAIFTKLFNIFDTGEQLQIDIERMMKTEKMFDSKSIERVFTITDEVHAIEQILSNVITELFSFRIYENIHEDFYTFIKHCINIFICSVLKK